MVGLRDRLESYRAELYKSSSMADHGECAGVGPPEAEGIVTNHMEPSSEAAAALLGCLPGPSALPKKKKQVKTPEQLLYERTTQKLFAYE